MPSLSASVPSSDVRTAFLSRSPPRRPEEEEEEEDGGLHDSGGLFVTSLTEKLQAAPSATVRAVSGREKRVFAATAREFDEFVRTQVPGQLSRGGAVLESSQEPVTVQGKELHCKFRYHRPPNLRTAALRLYLLVNIV